MFQQSYSKIVTFIAKSKRAEINAALFTFSTIGSCFIRISCTKNFIKFDGLDWKIVDFEVNKLTKFPNYFIEGPKWMIFKFTWTLKLISRFNSLCNILVVKQSIHDYILMLEAP